MELVQYISAYREINSIYEKFVDEKHYSFKNQQKLTDFYKTILDLAKIEKSISKEVENRDVKLNVFKHVLNENIDLFNNNSFDFKNLDIYYICRKELNKFNDQIEYQKQKIDELNHKLKISKSKIGDFFLVNKTGINDRDIEFYYSLKKEYDSEADKLNVLHEKRRNTLIYTSKYSKNIFFDFKNQTEKIIEILTEYTKSDFNYMTSENEIYFDTEITGKLHKICNNNIFHPIDEISFYFEFNLINTNSKLIKKAESVAKINYLIANLKDKIEDKRKSRFWVESILEKLEMKMSTYKSKAKNINEESSESLFNFKSDIDEIISRL